MTTVPRFSSGGLLFHPKRGEKKKKSEPENVAQTRGVAPKTRCFQNAQKNRKIGKKKNGKPQGT